ncbi:HlyD family secretion protein [Methylosinus sp. LW4]|uniref:HlyD family secretion protein n=1 Tax=Methylosinus sp. LW4 TaxID=136993 RepID=UPI00035C5378|nr:HlyD family efflux transporter periplasmic adaptor subunit [Methylosinus sp. LW4]
MNRGIARTLLALLVIGAAAAGYWWWRSHRPALPAYVSRANGRLEMTRIDIAVKYAGRIIDLPIREGDVVRPGAVLARQDAAEIKAQIAGAEAQRQRAISAIGRAEAELDVRRNNLRLAGLEMTETATMRGKALVSQVELDRRRIAKDAETAGAAAAEAAVKEARNALSEVEAQIARLKAILDETTIRAPVNGRIEYRIVEKDAVLPSGGRIASLLETDDVYMTVFFPMAVAGRLTIGDEARVALDAFDGPPLPATISFVAAEAQFTPKYVETASEREKLVYRVKLRIPVEAARRLDGRLKAGMTGNGYVRVDPTGRWPSSLALGYAK